MSTCGRKENFVKKNIIRALILVISVVVLIVAFASIPSFYENDTTVMLSQGSISFFNLGEVAELSAAVVKNGVEVDLAEDGEKIVWSSSDYGVATVDNGVVMSVGYGSCVIWARYGEYSAFCTVSNPNPNPMFTISETELFLDNISSTKALHLITDVGENISSAANWRSSNDNVASCRDGVITATGYGSCIVTATYNRKAVSCIVTVNNPTAPIITLSEEKLKLQIGQTHELLAITDNNAGNEIVWKSSDPTVATCEDGVVTAKKDGTCAIIAITERGYSDVCIVTSGKGQKPIEHSDYLDFRFPDIGKELHSVDKTIGQVSTSAVVIGYTMKTLLLEDGRLVVEISLICMKTYDSEGPDATNPARITATLYRENDAFCDKRIYMAQNVAVGDVFQVKCSGFTVQTKSDGTVREFYMTFSTVTER